ncbi:MAG: flagellar basal body P-ring formation chaperone FlgA [Bacteroidota bacterium]
MLLALAISLFLVAPDAEQAVEHAATAYLATHYPADAHRLDVEVRRLGGDVVEGTDLDVRFKAFAAEIPKGRTQVEVWQGREKTGWALLYVTHYDSVLVAAATLKRDAPVDPADVQIAWMDVTRFNGEPMRPDDFANLTEAFATRRINAGRALRRDDLREAFAADLGATVVMRYERNGFRFDLSGKARQRGAVGDIIKLYVEDTDVTYRARLTAPGRAVWLETL